MADTTTHRPGCPAMGGNGPCICRSETTTNAAPGEPDTKEFTVLGQFLMACADQHMDGAKMMAAMAYLVARDGQSAAPTADIEAKAARWDYLCRYWGTINVRHNKKDSSIKGFTLIFHADQGVGKSGPHALERLVDQAIAEETQKEQQA